MAAPSVEEDEVAETARWLSNQLGRPFPVERVFPGHVANWRVWRANHGRVTS